MIDIIPQLAGKMPLIYHLYIAPDPSENDPTEDKQSFFFTGKLLLILEKGAFLKYNISITWPPLA